MPNRKQVKPGGSAPAAIRNRVAGIDKAVDQAVRGTPKTKTFGDVLKDAMSDPERKKNLQVQLSDAGFSTKKNTARDKLRLRRIKDKRK